jgi:hypothetical protein
MRTAVLGQGLANIGTTSDQGAEGGREVVFFQGAFEDPCDSNRDERGGGRRFPEHTITGDQSKGAVPAVDSNYNKKDDEEGRFFSATAFALYLGS